MLGLFDVAEVVIVGANFGGFALPHKRDDLGDLGLRLLEVGFGGELLELVGSVDDPWVGRTRNLLGRGLKRA